MMKEFLTSRIWQLAQERGLENRYQIYKRCTGVGRSTIYKTIDGKSYPTMYTLEQICEGLEVTIQEFFNTGEGKIILSAGERIDVERSRKLDEGDRQRISTYIKALFDQAEEKEKET